ncbi:hypothetical protein Tco_0943738, partial [Tanacetum coccineum]
VTGNSENDEVLHRTSDRCGRSVSRGINRSDINNIASRADGSCKYQDTQNSLSLGDKESKQSSEHHDDTPDEEVLCLFAATPDFPKSVICNVDGVTLKFLEIGERMFVVKEVHGHEILLNAFVTHITSFCPTLRSRARS